MNLTQRIASAYLAKQAAAPQVLAAGVKQQVNADLVKRGLNGVQFFRTPSQVVSLIVTVFQKYNLSAPSMSPFQMQKDKGSFLLNLEITSDSDPLNPAKVQPTQLSLQYAKTPTGQYTVKAQLVK